MSNQQNNEVFVIESPVDAVAFMTALLWFYCVNLRQECSAL